MTTDLTGAELADVLGLKTVKLGAGDCELYAETTPSEGPDVEAYCFPFGLARSDTERWRVGRLLIGDVPTEDDVARYEAGLDVPVDSA